MKNGFGTFPNGRSGGGEKGASMLNRRIGVEMDGGCGKCTEAIKGKHFNSSLFFVRDLIGEGLSITKLFFSL